MRVYSANDEKETVLQSDSLRKTNNMNFMVAHSLGMSQWGHYSGLHTCYYTPVQLNERRFNGKATFLLKSNMTDLIPWEKVCGVPTDDSQLMSSFFLFSRTDGNSQRKL